MKLAYVGLIEHVVYDRVDRADRILHVVEQNLWIECNIVLYEVLRHV